MMNIHLSHGTQSYFPAFYDSTKVSILQERDIRGAWF